jgi:hypothetical protein
LGDHDGLRFGRWLCDDYRLGLRLRLGSDNRDSFRFGCGNHYRLRLGNDDWLRLGLPARR